MRRLVPLLPLLAVVVAACLFGTTGTALQRLVPRADPNGVSAVRLLIGALVLCAIAPIRALRAPATGPNRTDWRWRWLVVGGIAVGVYQLCFFTATTRTGVALGTVVTIGSGPVFSGVIDAAVHRRRPAPAWCLGTAISVVGVVVLGLVGRSSSVDAWGILAALGSGLGWAVYATVGKHQIDRGLGSTACMAALFGVGAVVISPFLVTAHVGWFTSGRGVSLALYLGVFTVGAAYTLYGIGLRHLPAPTVITLTLMEPITAALLSVTVLDETIGVAGWFGIALVLCGLVVTARLVAGRSAGSEQPDAVTTTVPG